MAGPCGCWGNDWFNLAHLYSTEIFWGKSVPWLTIQALVSVFILTQTLPLSSCVSLESNWTSLKFRWYILKKKNEDNSGIFITCYCQDEMRSHTSAFSTGNLAQELLKKCWLWGKRWKGNLKGYASEAMSISVTARSTDNSLGSAERLVTSISPPVIAS